MHRNELTAWQDYEMKSVYHRMSYRLKSSDRKGWFYNEPILTINTKAKLVQYTLQESIKVTCLTGNVWLFLLQSESTDDSFCSEFLLLGHANPSARTGEKLKWPRHGSILIFVSIIKWRIQAAQLIRQYSCIVTVTLQQTIFFAW